MTDLNPAPYVPEARAHHAETGKCPHCNDRVDTVADDGVCRACHVHSLGDWPASECEPDCSDCAENARERADRVTEAADRFAEVWTSCGALPHEIAQALQCVEVDTLAELLRATGHPSDADAWTAAHAEADESDDAHYAGTAAD